jgi:hypothetical protein
MAIPEVHKSLTKALREIPEKGKSENGRINTDVIVVLGGLEPPTSPLSGRRPSQYVCLQNQNLAVSRKGALSLPIVEPDL